MTGEFRRAGAWPQLEIRRSCTENSCYRPHSHDTVSIGLIDEGTSVFRGPPGGTVRLLPGDVVVIPAGHVHACNPDAGRWRYQMVHLDETWAASLLDRDDPSSRALMNEVRVLRRPDLHRRISEACDAILTLDPATDTDPDTDPDVHLDPVLRAVAAAAPDHVVPDGTDAALRARLRPVLERLRGDETNPPLDELARLVGLSRGELVRAVRRATGLSPLAWRQNARIVRARNLLRAGRPIADTAQALGFTDQSHFHRVFRAHVAASPGVYRGRAHERTRPTA